MKDAYLRSILQREAVDTGPYSPVRNVQSILSPLVTRWAAGHLSSWAPSGSFAKGTANKSGTDIDLFISLSSTTPDSLKQIHATLAKAVLLNGYTPRLQNVSVRIQVDGYQVDLVPAKRQSAYGGEHSLYLRRRDSWTKTNVQKHISYVSGRNRTSEIRILKLWRDQNGLDFPSFYLELVAIAALRGHAIGNLSANVWHVLGYLRDTFSTARFVDPANTNNIISDDLTLLEKSKIKFAAETALRATNWNQIVI